eukprot:Hpha_TRINITY_DN13904_c0_g1::TRINITY_DN13904_c0_g1_i1::g.35826::m.35826
MSGAVVNETLDKLENGKWSVKEIRYTGDDDCRGVDISGKGKGNGGKYDPTGEKAEYSISPNPHKDKAYKENAKQFYRDLGEAAIDAFLKNDKKWQSSVSPKKSDYTLTKK